MFRVEPDAPPGPYAPDLFDRLTVDLLAMFPGRFGRHGARAAVMQLLGGQAVVVPPDLFRGVPGAQTILYPANRKAR